ncbi:hypothetical protein Lal_00045620 [Lupinus albus]|nr:hypothetical protein Lal_00045620 [Lupinus albus]
MYVTRLGDRGIGTPISLDDATQGRSFGHFARVLVDINLKGLLPDQILVERDGFGFHVMVEYEKLHNLCTICHSIGHLVSNCRKVLKKSVVEVDHTKSYKKDTIIPPTIHKDPVKEFFIQLDINPEVTSNDELVGSCPIINKSSRELGMEVDKIGEVELLSDVETNTTSNATDRGHDWDGDQVTMVKPMEVLCNPIAAQDMRIIGKLWADDQVEDKEEEERDFTPVLSRSQKKSLKNKDMVFVYEPMISPEDINPLFWAVLNLKLFVVNNRDALLPNIWGLYRVDLSPIIIANSPQQISVSIILENQSVNVCAVYAKTCYLQEKSMGWLLPNLNSNKVILIPNFPGAVNIEDFRPIALANFQFKIITKVIADKLVLVAPNIVFSQQRGFIKERQILDCLCSTSEAINLLDHKAFGGNMAIKIDIKKAFDTMD